MQKTIDTILKKEMSRKEFLGMIGLGIISMIGISSMLKNLGDSFGKQVKSSSTGLEYGDSIYGGYGGGAGKPKGLF